MTAGHRARPVTELRQSVPPYVAAALAVNRIGTQTNANLVGVTLSNFNNGIGHWTQTTDDLLLSAESDNQIDTIAVGMSAVIAASCLLSLWLIQRQRRISVRLAELRVRAESANRLKSEFLA